MRMKINFAIITGLLLCAIPGVFAQQAVISELTGTVELQRAGSTEWENAAAGQSIMTDTVISTGFRSYALLSIGNSQINVRPLTRLSITELSTRNQNETINISLKVGKVRSDVNPPAGARSSYTAVSPMAVASVRGTVFEMGTLELRVIEGTVEYIGTAGPSVLVDADGYSYIDQKTGRAVPSVQGLFTALNPNMPIAYDLFNPFEGAYWNAGQINNSSNTRSSSSNTGGLVSPINYN